MKTQVLLIFWSLSWDYVQSTEHDLRKRIELLAKLVFSFSIIVFNMIKLLVIVLQWRWLPKLIYLNSAISISTFLYFICKYSTSQTEISDGELINFCFNGEHNESNGITRYGAISTSNQESIFKKVSLKLAINYLQGICYFTLGNICFRQLIVIPVGSKAH